MKRIIFFNIIIIAAIASVFLLITYYKEKKQQISIETQSQNTEIVSFVTPHHLVAQKLIENIFSTVANQDAGVKFDRVILISPNHFLAGKGWVNTSSQDWNKKDVSVSVDREAALKLKEDNVAQDDPEAFSEEHGIYNLIPFVGKYFSGVPVLSIMIRDEMPIQKANELARALGNLPGKSLVILSSDFSHELENNLSEFHDQKAIETIQNLDYSQVYNLDTDCTPGLYVAMKYSELKGYKDFKLLENSNSSKIYGKNFIGENTSYVTGYFSKENKDNKKTAHLLFLGDLMLDRSVRTLMEKKGVGWLTEKIRRLFWSQDANIANLEGPVTDKNSVSVLAKETEKNHFVFTFDPGKTGNFLTENRITIASLGNNHILNFSEKGLSETEKNLEKFNVAYFGDPKTEENFLIKEINGIKIGFVNYNAFSGINAEKTIANIKKAKAQSDFIIIYTHWGKEYELTQDEKQKNLAHQFIDSGADLIIGSHPHVVQPIEIYRNKAIFYSLGNFIFDQYFSEDVKERLAVGVSISAEKLEFYLEPLYLEKNGQLTLAKEEKRNNLLTRLAGNSEVSVEIKKGILEGKFTIPNN